MVEHNGEKERHVTVRVSNRLDREIEEWRETRGYEKSEAVRKLLKRGLDYDDKMGEIEDRIHEIEMTVQDIDDRTTELESGVVERLGFDPSIGAIEEEYPDQDDPPGGGEPY